MKKKLAITLIPLTTLISSIFFEKAWWLPATFFVAAIVDAATRQWVMSNRMGSSMTLSTFIKSLCSLAIFYSIIGQFVCIWLLIKWFVL